ncbi:glycine zipper family protein [Roseomonas rosulenta]|uniref:glycine zipper family protein n=1 Tax=Roseomonas rosulenta TaxID=2748667 RepID=UPI0018DFABC5|nr:glycine zipper family protein [Roseomonas rosulenta]
MTTIKSLRLAALLVAGIGLAGCEGMSDSQRATATGAGIGALGGAAIGSLSGNAGWGALIGAGVGGVSGYAIDRGRR